MNNNGSIAIIGAGTMGSGIAQKYATHGFKVTIIDQSEESLNRSKNSITEMLDQAISRGIFTHDNKTAIIQNLHWSKQLQDAKDSSLVVEAIFEDVALKQEVFRSLEDICAKDTIFASNTSSFTIASLQQALKHPERVCGLHYFFHPAKNRLVELIGSPLTHPQILQKALQLQNAINKVVISSKDSPGFIVNRFFVPWLNEAVHMLDEGFANAATIDAAARAFFAIGMGPFELMNVTGPLITFHACNSLAKSFGPFYEPSPTIAKKIEAGLTFELDGPIQEEIFYDIGMRLLAVVSAISAQLVFLEEVCSISDVDLGARVGLLWKKGPFELTGLHKNELPSYIQKLSQHRNLAIPSILNARLLQKRPFANIHVTTSQQDSVGIITMNKPDSLNALDEGLLQELTNAFSDMQENHAISSIVITGCQKAFMAGADLAFFNHHLARNDSAPIIKFALAAQQLFSDIDRSKKPVIAAVSALALGGGLELALACDVIVADKKAKFAFPETGIGIYPGLGGTERTPRKIGVALARYLILSGAMVNAHDAYNMGLIDVIAENDVVQTALSVAKNRPAQRAAQQVDDLMAAFMPGQKIKDTSERASKAWAKVAEKAPIALRIADELIMAAEQNLQNPELERESKILTSIFTTQDAKIGLKAAAAKQKPLFEGR